VEKELVKGRGRVFENGREQPTLLARELEVEAHIISRVPKVENK